MVSTPPQPDQVIPLLLPAAPALWDALREGIEYANHLQPDEESRDPWFWSHAARWKASGRVAGSQVAEDPWSMVENVANCGIHILFDDLHIARVVRSLGGTTPHAGSNKRRNRAWNGVQGQLPLATGGALPPLSLIVDWQVTDDEPLIHVGLPAGNWQYGNTANLYWRVPLPAAGEDLSSLSFEPSPDAGGSLVRLKLDPSETADDVG